MQGRVQALSRYGAAIWAGGLLALAAVGVHAQQSPQPQQRSQAALTAEIPSGQHRVLRLRNLPKDAQLGLAIQTTGRVTVVLLGEGDYKRWPEPETPLLTAPVDKALSFTVIVPEAGNYYVAFDNRQGTTDQKIKMVIRAARGRSTAPGQPGSSLQPKPEQHDF
ncbi:MAG: hypothetical protein KIT73_16515 [Burkholderiales bacterium]|nr:hypothetical protein [Burkholderiales bacterium]